MRLCPFCKEIDGSLEHSTYSRFRKIKWFVKCPHCGARTGIFDNPEDAKKSWNGVISVRKEQSS